MILRTANWWRVIAGLGLFLLATTLSSTVCWANDEPQIVLTPKSAERPAVFEALGLAAADLNELKTLEPGAPAFTQIFAVYVVGERVDPALPPVGGSYRVDGSRLLFTPRYPPLPGLKYRAVLRFPAGHPQKIMQIEKTLALALVPNTLQPVARVEKIYPSSDTLPENQLRFYIHFSQPIDHGNAYDNLELLDEAGQPVESAFLELGEELWDPSDRRFTLLLDPGRIKQGLKPRAELGPILHSGKKYTLVVKRHWKDVQGRLLAAEAHKHFSVGPAVDQPINTKLWKISAPRIGTTEPLIVRFPSPLDHALLERTLSVVDKLNHAVVGQVSIADAERRWEFKPQAPWTSTGSQLVVDTVLEDTAGNSIGRAFEVDEQHPITSSVVTDHVKFPIIFSPKNPAAR